ncbi:MAG: hypothetical protein REJ24_08440, partial [Rhodocyclaceae bacterium]|nr:hypothetical protein [Rhodocyclaceae bacterium]
GAGDAAAGLRSRLPPLEAPSIDFMSGPGMAALRGTKAVLGKKVSLERRGGAPVAARSSGIDGRRPRPWPRVSPEAATLAGTLHAYYYLSNDKFAEFGTD